MENYSILNLTKEDIKTDRGLTITTYTLTTGYFATPMGGPERIEKTLIVKETPKAI
jgi:hypothetical protein